MPEPDRFAYSIDEFDLAAREGGDSIVSVQCFTPVPSLNAKNRLQNVALFQDILQHNSR